MNIIFAFSYDSDTGRYSYTAGVPLATALVVLQEVIVSEKVAQALAKKNKEQKNEGNTTVAQSSAQKEVGAGVQSG